MPLFYSCFMGFPPALHWAINSVKKGGIVAIVGVNGPTDNLILIGNLVNKGITIRAIQASVQRLLPRLIDDIMEAGVSIFCVLTH